MGVCRPVLAGSGTGLKLSLTSSSSPFPLLASSCSLYFKCAWFFIKMRTISSLPLHAAHNREFHPFSSYWTSAPFLIASTTASKSLAYTAFISDASLSAWDICTSSTSSESSSKSLPALSASTIVCFLELISFVLNVLFETKYSNYVPAA